jgi:hypothetical protein
MNHVCCLCCKEHQEVVNCSGSVKYNCENRFCHNCMNELNKPYCMNCDIRLLEQEQNNRRYKMASMLCSCLGVLVLGIIRIFVR